MAITIADHHPSYPSWAITKDIDIATKMSPGPEAKLLKEAGLGRVQTPITVGNVTACTRSPACSGALLPSRLQNDGKGWSVSPHY